MGLFGFELIGGNEFARALESASTLTSLTVRPIARAVERSTTRAVGTARKHTPKKTGKTAAAWSSRKTGKLSAEIVNDLPHAQALNFGHDSAKPAKILAKTIREERPKLTDDMSRGMAEHFEQVARS